MTRMDAEMRRQLREQVDAARRAVVEKSGINGRFHCSDCGAAFDCYTTGCKKCWDRRRTILRRERRGVAA